MAKIFEPYFTTKETGTGLGLTMVYKILREHQGDITVRSREGEGSVFVMSLPLLRSNKPLLTDQKQGQTE
jgi:signal transduction histidine kinase